MTPTVATPAPRGTLFARFQAWFFQSFYSLLLLAIAAAQWATLVWAIARRAAPMPPWLHVVAPLAFHALNQWLLRRPRPASNAGRAFLRLYTATAFTSVFAGGVLLLGALGGAGVTIVAGPLSHLMGQEAHRWVAGDVGGLVLGTVVDASTAAVLALFTYGYTRGHRHLSVDTYEVPIAGLPRALDGFRIAHISDLHIGQFLDAHELASHVDAINRLGVDLVCLTGDLVDRAETCETGFPILAGLRATHGAVATLGNHDHGAGADRVAGAWRRHTPFPILRDEPLDVTAGDARLCLVGLDDRGHDWARGLARDPALPGLMRHAASADAVVVLSHRPDCYPHAAELGAHLVLSGHTHGGQLGVPFGRRVRNLAEFITPFDRGIYRTATSTLLVNRGIGFTGQRIRLFTPREIAVLTLRPA